jgi:hypothetical protein
LTDEDFRGLVLGFPETTEGRHATLPTSHVQGRRFATLGWPEPGKVSSALGVEEQDLLLATCPHDSDALKAPRVGASIAI